MFVSLVFLPLFSFKSSCLEFSIINVHPHKIFSFKKIPILIGTFQVWYYACDILLMRYENSFYLEGSIDRATWIGYGDPRYSAPATRIHRERKTKASRIGGKMIRLAETESRDEKQWESFAIVIISFIKFWSLSSSSLCLRSFLLFLLLHVYLNVQLLIIDNREIFFIYKTY